jgi:hypothetical protein
MVSKSDGEAAIDLEASNREPDVTVDVDIEAKDQSS